MVFLIRRVWSSFMTRLRIRKNGLLKLSNDVRMCEYEDVHVMWEMLRKTEPDICRHIKAPKRHMTNSWASRVPHLCRSL
ncbi:hypothetical protein IFM89_012192 [Coptis chinensis]|uniref:Uncharacterized protein n=1 Tax=Coptis chinensis TaxID=261450 RepID=A0A835HPK3_9MAGN|nr:hypothetical protein IFM89_012192 [Coptis chinensis]